jgi:hypothetical protein
MWKNVYWKIIQGATLGPQGENLIEDEWSMACADITNRLICLAYMIQMAWVELEQVFTP